MSTNDDRGSVIERFGYRLSGVVERWLPSPFLFAILLTYVVFLAGVVTTDTGPTAMVGHWYDGFWAFLGFSMQMVVILMTGFVVAYHPRVNAVVRRLTRLPNTGKTAVVFVGVVTMVLGWVHWGTSLVGGAIFAREMGKTAHERGIDVHYPVLCVAGYLGLGLTWHWGLSGSAPLLLASEGNEFVTELGVLEGVVPASETILHPYGLALTALSIAFAALVLYLVSPTGDRATGITAYVPESELFDAATDGGDARTPDGDDARTPDGDRTETPAERLGQSRLLGGVLAATGVAVVVGQFLTRGIDALGLDLVNFGFLMIGLLLYTRPAYYRERFGEAADAAAGVVLLFPFFAGIQGMMTGSGLASQIAAALLSVSGPETLPVVAWLVGSVVNLFVPSGGGEWIVLGPPVLEAAQAANVPIGQATMAYAVGDAHTNLLNPFWALPLLAITGIDAREMFGYALVLLLALIPFLGVTLFLLPY